MELVLRDLRSQHMTVLSKLPEIANDDSSLYLTQVTGAACPLNLRKGCPVETSQTITDLSEDDDNI
jgi:hypothetical protein